jgi:hypothetical protein
VSHLRRTNLRRCAFWLIPLVFGLLLSSRDASAQATPAAARTELVLVSTFEGVGLGMLTGLALDAPARGVVGGAAVGGLVGLAASVGFTVGRLVPPALPLMFLTGSIYGAFAGFLYYEACEPCDNLSASMATGASLGILSAGAFVLLARLSGGAAGATTFGVVASVLVAVGAAFIIDPRLFLYGVALASITGATLGLGAGPFLQRWLAYPRDRWLTLLRTTLLGTLVGLAASLVTAPGARVVALVSLAGGVIGAGLGVALTWEDAPVAAPGPQAVLLPRVLPTAGPTFVVPVFAAGF